MTLSLSTRMNILLDRKCSGDYAVTDPIKNQISLHLLFFLIIFLIYTFRMQDTSGWRYNIGYIVCWYSLSTLLSIYNKTLLGREGLNLPLFMSAVHSGIHAIISRYLIRKYNQNVQSYSMLDYITKVVSFRRE